MCCADDSGGCRRRRRHEAALRVVRHGLRLLPLVLVLALVVPGSGVRPTTIGLMKVQPAEAYDFADGVVWALVLGEDAEGQTDLIQLLGINFRNGDAAAIGIPRDSWFELSAEVGEERINKAYDEGGAELAAGAVERLVGIPPDYVLVTDTDGFMAMVGDPRGGRRSTPTFAFQAEDSDLQVHRGVNTSRAQEALDFATTRTTLARGDFDRSAQPPGAAARPPRTAPRQGRRAGLHRDARPRRRRRHRHRQPVAPGPLPPAQRADLGRPRRRRRGASCSAPTPRARSVAPSSIPDFELAQRLRPTTSAPTRASTQDCPERRLDRGTSPDSMPASRASTIAWARWATCSLAKMLLAWLRTVLIDRPRSRAISALSRPSAILPRITRSRSVSSGNAWAVGRPARGGSTSSRARRSRARRSPRRRRRPRSRGWISWRRAPLSR